MEQMTQDLNIENFDLKTIQKLYNSSTKSNLFLNRYTMLDVESGKKKTYTYLLRKYNNNKPEYIQKFVELTAVELAKDLFKVNNFDGSPIDGEILQRKDDVNTIHENHRIINIDSAYRSNLFSTNDKYDSYSSSDMVISLNDTLDNVISIELANICVPFTFYNINVDHGNNYFYIKDNGTEPIKIEINEGKYNSNDIINKINEVLAVKNINMTFSFDLLTNKVSIETLRTDGSYDVVFFDNSCNSDYAFNPQSLSDSKIKSNVRCKLNNSLGWLLGFRNVDTSNYDELMYNVTISQSVMAESICHVPYTKYFIVVIDDMNKAQSNKSLVQINYVKPQIKRKTYFKDIDNSLECLKDSNFNEYESSSRRDGLTKKELYSVLQTNNYRASFNENNSKLTANSINNVFAIIPFETKSLVWGESLFTSDKNKFRRTYATPVNISKLNVKLLDDRGNLINLNGAEWSLSIVSTHSYNI